MSSLETHEHPTRSRIVMRSIGGVLWVLAIVALFFVFRQNSSDQAETGPLAEAPNVVDTSGPNAPAVNNANDNNSVSSDKNSAEPPDDGKSNMRTLVLSAGEDGQSSVRVAKPGEDTSQPHWNPDGVQDFELIERSGKVVTKADLLGHPWVIGFVFTRCAGPCPKVSGQMKLLADKLKDTDVKFVTLSVDPKNDTPEVLTRYADALKADPEQWLFLTGDQHEIYGMIKLSFQMPVKEMLGEDRIPGYEIMHTTNLLHVDAEGRVVGKYNALKDTDMVALRRALTAQPKAD